MVTTISPIRLLHWTTWFNSIVFEGEDKFIENECSVPAGLEVNLKTASSWCIITTNQTQLDHSDAVLFHAADYSSNTIPIPNRKEQPWILYTLESPLTAPFRQDAQLMESFDYLASYHQKSQYFFTYFGPIVMDIANRALPTDFMRRKSKQAPILWIAKNCHASSGREQYISELMKYINIDSYGDCLNTKPFPLDKSREQLMTEYKFYLAIENANCEDYVTEKLIDTLRYSAVPIIDGPASYNGYLPNQRSAIRMDAYPDPRELANYIRFLDENDGAYLSYLQYRLDALSKSPIERMDPLFISLWGDQTAHDYRVSWCSICRHMATTWISRHNKNNTSLDTTLLEQESERKDRFIVDNTCMPHGKWNYAAAGPPYHSYSWTPTPKDEFAYEVLGLTPLQSPQPLQPTTTVPPLGTTNPTTSASQTYQQRETEQQSNLPLENGDSFHQDRLGMVALDSISITVVTFVLWLAYRYIKCTKSYRNKTPLVPL
ncbi:unnamed protein product [Absidia cylindrospora]